MDVVELRRLEREIDLKSSLGAAVKGRVVLVFTSGEYKHVTDLNFADGPCHDLSEIGTTHFSHVPT
jgi:hypothetical protein